MPQLRWVVSCYVPLSTGLHIHGRDTPFEAYVFRRHSNRGLGGRPDVGDFNLLLLYMSLYVGLGKFLTVLTIPNLSPEVVLHLIKINAAPY